MQTDLSDPTRNMFGLKPCPKCGDAHCYPTQPIHGQHPSGVVCDECGWNEPLEELNSEPAVMADDEPVCDLCNGTGFPGTTERNCPRCTEVNP